MKIDKEVILNMTPLLAASIVSLLWIIFSKEVSEDPHLLGLVRGFFYPTLAWTWVRLIAR